MSKKNRQTADIMGLLFYVIGTAAFIAYGFENLNLPVMYVTYFINQAPNTNIPQQYAIQNQPTAVLSLFFGDR
jgi:hypothetical protein